MGLYSDILHGDNKMPEGVNGHSTVHAEFVYAYRKTVKNF